MISSAAGPAGQQLPSLVAAGLASQQQQLPSLVAADLVGQQQLPSLVAAGLTGQQQLPSHVAAGLAGQQQLPSHVAAPTTEPPASQTSHHNQYFQDRFSEVKNLKSCCAFLF